MAQIPRTQAIDSTLGLWSDGYLFISERCRRLGTDVFETRLMLQPTICMLGRDAARMFYGSEALVRAGAAPRRIQTTLFGVGGVQGLDREQHRHRKAMFMAMMTPDAIGTLKRIAADEWRAAIPRWALRPKVDVLGASREVLCRSACRWSGVPLPEEDVRSRTEQLSALIDGGSRIGLPHWRARRARRRAEAWTADVIADARRGYPVPPDPSPLQLIAGPRDLQGELLEPRIAAVELLNVLRPIVAVGRYLSLLALALHRYPHALARVRDADETGYGDRLLQEVRRFYPFFPFAAARVAEQFDWQGITFPAGRRVLLDLYGTNHDARVWTDPEQFRPERFRDWTGDAFGLIPQGGGDHWTGHRCAGEWITIALMRVVLDLLVGEMRYRVPPQDLHVELRSMRDASKNSFLIEEVRAGGD